VSRRDSKDRILLNIEEAREKLRFRTGEKENRGKIPKGGISQGDIKMRGAKKAIDKAVGEGVDRGDNSQRGTGKRARGRRYKRAGNNQAES